jgi:hypothetical protein
MTQIVHFDMNVPIEVALKYPDGKAIEGRYGSRVMYTLADDRVMYVAPIVASRISQLGIEAGELFQICKLQKRDGQRKFIEWQVQRLENEPETQLERDLRESIKVAQAATDALPSEAAGEPCLQSPDAMPEQAQEQPQPVEPSPTPVPAVVPALNGSNGTAAISVRNGNGQPGSTTKLEHALKTAITAAYNAEKYGTELGYVVRFDADAIKSMAITVLINMSEGSRR